MIHIGNVNAGDEVKLRFATAAVRNESGIKTVALYAINEETVQAFKEYVLKNIMEFDGYDGNCLNGHITADKAGILYLAVPYNEGFMAVVDGKKGSSCKDRNRHDGRSGRSGGTCDYTDLSYTISDGGHMSVCDWNINIGRIFDYPSKKIIR